MDTRLVITGVTLLMAATGFTVYGLLGGYDVVTGVSLSLAVLGGTLASIGLTYRDPLTESAKTYAELLSSPLVKIVEDLGLLSKGVIQSCILDENTYLIMSESPLKSCNNISPGIGFSGDKAYLAFGIKTPALEPGELDSLLMSNGLAQYAAVQRGEGTVRVELRGLRQEFLGGEWKPINPYRMLVLLYASALYGRSYIVEEEEWSLDLYRVVLRAVGGERAG